VATSNPNFCAGGTIYVSRVVKAGASAQGSAVVTLCGTADQPVGVAYEGAYSQFLNPSDPQVAALVNQPIHVYGLGETALTEIDAAGLAVTAGQRVKVVTATGKIGPLVGAGQGGQWTLGIALNSGNPGDLIKVFIDPMQVAIPQS
jgi:hypothetical protein